ncbi:MAG TPA: SRPBCC family protein [Solirubrobacterales bacterium]|nr:SRPBCC family protein [Solirubrobacterales bacterium]
MKPIEVERRISAPTERVWAVITDLEGSADRLSGVEEVEILEGPEFGVGTRWRETRRMFGKEATEEMEVTGVVPGRSYTVGAESHGAKYLSELRVEGTGDGTSILTMSFDAEPQGFGAKLMAHTLGYLFRGGTRKALAKDLDDIAAAAEADA